MKSSTLFRVGILLMAFAALSSCSRNADSGGGGGSSSGAASPPIVVGSPTPTPTPGTDTGEDYWASESGASVAFTPVSLARMNEYVAVHPLNAPTNFRLYVEMKDISPGRNMWTGTLKIGYYDNAQLNTGVFAVENPNGVGYNVVSYNNYYKYLANAAFNQWFVYNGKKVFHAFFQDAYGAIVLVIDGGLDLGDGGGLTNLSGRVYFKNFRVAPAPQYVGSQGEQCWFLFSPSPYECGTFRYYNGVVSTTSALYPSEADGYQLLGTFQGMDKAKAFQE